MSRWKQQTQYLSGVAMVFGLASWLGFASTPAQAVGCGVTVGLDTLLTGGSISCDNKVYSGFTYSSTATGGATPVAASGLNITATFTGGVDNLTLSGGPFVALTGQLSDGDLSYIVTAINGAHIIAVDSSLNAFGVTGTGHVEIDDGFTAQNGAVYHLTQTNSNPSALLSIVATMMLSVVKDIGVSGDGGGTASLSNFTQSVHETPLPSTWIMMLTGLGLIGFGAFRRKAAAIA
jgi:hypothetical protein